MGLDVPLMHGFGVEFPLYDDVRILKPLVHVTQFVLDMTRDVAQHAGVIPSFESLDSESSGHVFVEERRAVSHGVFPGKHGGQHLVVHGYETQGYRASGPLL